MSTTNLQVHELAAEGMPMCQALHDLGARMRNVLSTVGLVGDTAVLGLARAHNRGMKAQFMKAHPTKGEQFSKGN